MDGNRFSWYLQFYDTTLKAYDGFIFSHLLASTSIDPSAAYEFGDIDKVTTRLTDESTIVKALDFSDMATSSGYWSNTGAYHSFSDTGVLTWQYVRVERSFESLYDATLPYAELIGTLDYPVYTGLKVFLADTGTDRQYKFDTSFTF